MFLSLFFSCLHKPITPMDAVRTYRIHIQGDFENVLLPEETDTVIVDLQLSVRSSERFSDDSVAYSVLVDQSEITWGTKTIESHLHGKWVQMRAFEYGELLSIAHMDDWSEEDEYIASFDVLWFMLFPNPPNIDKKESRPSLSRYPVLFSPLQKSRAVINGQWTLHSLKREAELGYEGKYDLRGTWDQREQSGSGTVKGEVLISETGGIPIKHTGRLQRELCFGSTETICQQQTFQFILEQL